MSTEAVTVVLCALGIAVLCVGYDQRQRTRRARRQAERDIARRQRQLDGVVEEVAGSLCQWATLLHEVSKANAVLTAENERLRFGPCSIAPSPLSIRFDAQGRPVASYIGRN